MTRIHTAALIGSLLLATALAACTLEPPPRFTQRDIQTAEQSGELESLYDQVAADLVTLDPNSRTAAKTRQLLDTIGTKLTDQMAEQVKADLADNLLPSDRYPLDVLDQQIARIADVEEWDALRYSKASAILDAERRRTTDEIAATERELQTLGEDQPGPRLHLLGQLTSLLGPGSEPYAGYAAKRAELLARLSRQAEQAMEREEYEEAQQALALVSEVSPGDAGVQDQLNTLDARLFERDFWAALEAGKPDQAYVRLQEMAEGERFEQIRGRLAASAEPMAAYFTALAAEATTAGRYPDAYRWFSQARGIQSMLGAGEAAGAPEEAQFLEVIEREYAAARDVGHHGLAWGFIRILELFGPESAELRGNRRETRETVLDLAIKRLTAAPFHNSSASASEFGEAVGSKVIQYLFELIPEDVRVIEREQLADILREQEIGSEQSSGASRLASANYLVEGTILEAKVDTVEKKGRRTMRVVTEQETLPNPKHEWWMGLSSKERSKLEEPPETITVPKKEDISFEVTVHRKVGIFSVSYRVIDAGTAKVLFADSVRSKVEYEDDSREGVELGDFRMEFKLEDLPSDLEILAQLADDVSEQIGTKLAEVLANPEDEYREAGDRFAAEGNYVGASQQYAYASVLFERKAKDSEELDEQLRRCSLSTISAGAP